MGLEKLLTDLSSPSTSTLILDDEYGMGNDGHPISFNQRSMAWPISYEEGKPLVTFGFDSESFGDLDPGAPEASPEAIDFGRNDGGLSGNRRWNDFKRIGKWIFGTGEGRGWIIKQTGLQLMNPRIDAPQKDLFTSISEGITNIFFFSGNTPKDPNQMTYNLGVNTMISVLMAGAGAIDREGLIPFMHSGYIDATGRKTWGIPGSLAQGNTGGYAESPTDGEEGEEAAETNKLVYLLDNKVKSNAKLGLIRDLGLEGSALGNFMQKAGDFINNNLGFLGLGGEGSELYSYAGGPDSKYGIGRTSIRRYVNSTLDNYGKKLTRVYFDPSAYASISGGSSIYSESQLPNFIRSLNAMGVEIKGELIKNPYFNYNKVISDDSGNRTYHRESRLGAGNPGKIISPISGSAWNQNEDGTINYRAFVADKVDKINALDIHENTNGGFMDNAYRDLIRFRFEAIDNDTPPTAESGLRSNVILFRAFIDDISDKYQASHNEFKYNGRGESFYTYKGFKRAISLSFKVAAQSRHEMMPLYRKLNYLVSNTAPDYSDNGRMRTPYMRMTVGSWMNRIPGVISSIGLTWDKDVPWEINMDGVPGEDENPHMLVLPHALNVSLEFIPIHNFLPRKGIQTPFILPNHKDIDGKFKPNQKWLSEGGDSTLKVVKGYLDKATVNRMNDGV